jgi:hypothetical protein
LYYAIRDSTLDVTRRPPLHPEEAPQQVADAIERLLRRRLAR